MNWKIITNEDEFPKIPYVQMIVYSHTFGQFFCKWNKKTEEYEFQVDIYPKLKYPTFNDIKNNFSHWLICNDPDDITQEDVR